MKIITIVSGGMDSATLLYHLRNEGHDVLALSFDYSQRHRKELLAAELLCKDLKVPHLVHPVVIPAASALQGTCDVPDGHYTDESMRATVVPSRNLIFLTLASAYAVRESASAVAYGAHSGDHAIYPDCREEFADAVARVFQLANWRPVQLVRPFIGKTKGQIAELGWNLHVPFEHTWSCYKGGAKHCGTCGTCVERKEAFVDAMVPDPTEYLA